MATTQNIAQFTTRFLENEMNDHSDYKMKLINTSSTEYPSGAGSTGAQALTSSWSSTLGTDVTNTPSAGNVFTATGNWGTIDSVKVWFDTDGEDFEMPLDTSRNLAGNNYELTVDIIEFTIS